jgi:hypothetical protein
MGARQVVAGTEWSPRHAGFQSRGTLNVLISVGFPQTSFEMGGNDSGSGGSTKLVGLAATWHCASAVPFDPDAAGERSPTMGVIGFA